MTVDSFGFEYEPGTILYGRDSAGALGTELAQRGVERALLVTGTTVGQTPAVVEPVREGVGDRLTGVFAETTPQKRLETALDGVERASEVDALVSLGGGSSLDVATVMSVLAADDRPRETIRSAFVETGTLPVPETELVPVFAVPTTLAGADLSVAAGITAYPDDRPPVRGGVFDQRLMPEALVYDPSLIETTPHEVLCASAMNGFDKGIESLYAHNRTPITDATATRGLESLAEGLPRLGSGARDDRTLHDVIVGTMLVQYGVSRGSRTERRNAPQAGKSEAPRAVGRGPTTAGRSPVTTLSLIHAFGHGISGGYDVQQGEAHGIIAPHALAFLFDRVDGRREELAEALGVESSAATATAVIDAVTEIRDALGLPSRLRSIPDLSNDDLPAVAGAVAADSLLGNTPDGFDPTETEIEGVLESAW